MMRPLAAVALSILAACGSEPTSTGGFGVIQSLGSGLLSQSRAPAPAPLTRAEIRAVGTPLLQVEVPSTGAIAYVGVQGNRGDVVTWATTSRESIALKGGQLMQTRGFGADLLSAEVPGLEQLLTGQPVTRRYFHLDGAEGTVETVVTCTPRVVGAETVAVLGLSYQTARVDEVCTGPDLSFTNSFWIDSASRLRQSVQWVSPRVGQVRISDLQE